MSDDSGSLGVDYLSKGLTRPSMIFGVSTTFFALNIMASTSVYIFTKKLTIILLVMPAIHAVGYTICFKEPLFLELFILKNQKCSVCRNKHHHGHNSYDPL